MRGLLITFPFFHCRLKYYSYIAVSLNIKNRTMKKLAKYRENLSYDNKFIYSYGTKVAEIKGETVVKLGYWSVTTSKHINYAAKELNKKVL